MAQWISIGQWRIWDKYFIYGKLDAWKGETKGIGEHMLYYGTHWARVGYGFMIKVM